MKRIIAAAVVLVVLIPTLLICCAVNYYIHQTIRNDMLDAMNDTALMMEAQITKSYNRLISDIQLKAENEVLLSVLKAAGNSAGSTGSVDSSGVGKVLLESKGFPVIDGAVLNQEGEIVFSSQPDEEGLMLNKTELYQDIMQGEDFYEGLVTSEEITDIIVIAVPILDDQKTIRGILKQSIDIEILSDYLGSIKPGASGEAFLIRDNGFLIFDRNQENLPFFYYEYQDKHSLEKLILDYKKGRLIDDQGIANFESKGIEYIGVYKKIEPIRSIAVVSLKQDDMYDSLPGLRVILPFLLLIVITASAAVVYLILYFYITPLKRINETLKKIANGDLTARCSIKRNKELEELSRYINNLADSYQKNEKELRMSSRIDDFTHLPNRNAIYELLDTLLYKHRNQALMLLDLEGFKDVNDNLGHDVGDRILTEIGDILRELPQHVCYSSRLGGAEFLVFITNWTSPRYPEKIAEKIIKKIEGIRFIDEVRVDISASAGIVYMDSEKTDKKKLIKQSNIALHKARSIGRNAYFVYYPNMQKE